MNELLRDDSQNIWHPFTPLEGADTPLLITEANGIYLRTHDGKEIIDAVSSWWVNLHGHANPKIAQALATQALKLEHVIFAGFTHEPAIQLSRNLRSILPPNQQKIFFSDNGSTSVEVALKMAFQYWFNRGIEKRKVIALQGAYHGDTFGSMSVGERGLFTDPFSPFLFETAFVDFPNGVNEKIVLEQFSHAVKNNDVAAFIFEPLIQAAAGMRMYSADVLDKLIRIAHDHDVLCIADEVFTGFGRTGRFFASDYLANKPDIMALSKGLTGGTLPLGVTSCSEKIISAFKTAEFTKTFFHGHSYTANPLACASANASFSLLTDEKCLQQIATISDLQKQFTSTLKGTSKIKEARSMGTILAVELANEEATSYSNSIRKKIYPYFLERNILLRPLGNVIYVVPPYVIKKEELQYIHSAIQDFVSEL